MSSATRLTRDERSELEACEDVIRKGLATFLEVGHALARIRDGRLYRLEFKTFEEYCRRRWDMSRTRAHELASAYEIGLDVRHGEQNLQVTERALRPLAAVPSSERRAAFEEAERIAEKEGAARVTGRHVEAAVSKHAVHFSSKTPEHYTPKEVIDLVLEVFGKIDLDPCSDKRGNVPAKKRYTEKEDGLSKRWSGKVYMNPPYGREIDAWIDKLVESYDVEGIEAAIALVPARIDTGWWDRLTASGDAVVGFFRGRLTFVGNDSGAPFPSALVYLGDDSESFSKAFGSHGGVWQRLW